MPHKAKDPAKAGASVGQWKCPHCDQVFNYKIALHSHVRHRHPEAEKPSTVHEKTAPVIAKDDQARVRLLGRIEENRIKINTLRKQIAGAGKRSFGNALFSVRSDAVLSLQRELRGFEETQADLINQLKAIK